MTDKIQNALNMAEEAMLTCVIYDDGEVRTKSYDNDKIWDAIVAIRAAKIELELIKNKQIEDSWRNNPDRSGGQFTQDEINNKDWYH